MINKILVIVVSRGRPERMEEALEGWQSTQTGYSDLILMLDDDDEKLGEYHKITDKYENVEVNVSDIIRKEIRETGLFPRGSALLLTAGYKAKPDYKYYGLLSDDIIIRTKGWDKMMIDKIEKEGGWAIVYGDDLITKKPTIPFISANLINTVGYISPKGIIQTRVDRAWWEIGKATRTIHFMPEIIMEHIHPRFKKCTAVEIEKIDKTYTIMRSVRLLHHDQAIYSKWEKEELPIIVKKINEARKI